MPSLTIENYVKTIYQLCLEQNGEPATTGKVAVALAVSPGTVTSMLKTLGETGLATYTPYEGVRLTDSGRGLALRVLRRHRLIELFLVRTLNLTWDEVHAEAENMEHAVSDWLVDRIDAFLEYPEADPHGDPIPTADGHLRASHARPLAECATGETFRIARVMDQSPEFLRYLTTAGLVLSAEGRVVANLPEAGIITVAVEAQEATLGRNVAMKIQVKSAPVS